MAEKQLSSALLLILLGLILAAPAASYVGRALMPSSAAAQTVDRSAKPATCDIKG
jgi:hypothetical protein